MAGPAWGAALGPELSTWAPNRAPGPQTKQLGPESSPRPRTEPLGPKPSTWALNQALAPALWDFYFKFISIHYQDVFKVEMGVKISGIYHRVQIYWFGARPFSLGGARMEKSCKSSQKTTKNAVFARFFHPRSS